MAIFDGLYKVYNVLQHEVNIDLSVGLFFIHYLCSSFFATAGDIWYISTCGHIALTIYMEYMEGIGKQQYWWGEE